MSEKKRQSHIDQEDLWKMRALEAQRGRLEAEIRLGQRSLRDTDNETQTLIAELAEKYGPISRIEPDGEIVYLEEAPSESKEKDSKEK